MATAPPPKTAVVAEISRLEHRIGVLESEAARRDTLEWQLRTVIGTQLREELFLKEQCRLLELIVSGRPLADCLSELCEAVARLEPRARAAVLLADEARRAMLRTISPHLLPSFGEGLVGAPVGELALGACGTAIYSSQPIACADIARDERWSGEWRALCVTHGVLACHSAPVFDAAGVARASFMLCFDQPHVLDESELRLVDFGVHIANLALQRERSEEALRASEARLEAELVDASLLQRTSAQLIDQENVGALYETILDAALEIMHSDFGSMQLLYPERGNGGELRLLAFRGFNAQAATFWEWVRADSESTCGRALRTGERVVAADVEKCAFMAGTEDLATYLDTGIHAVQTTPLLSRTGQILGMISTHWRAPHEPSERELRMLDILVRQAADLLERRLAEERERRILDEVLMARVEAEEARARADLANRAKSDFLATMSHELRTPLNAIGGYAQLMQLGVPEPAPVTHQEYLLRIQQNQSHLLGLINEVLNYARIEAGRIDYDVVDLVAGELLASIEPLVAPQVRAKRQSYRCESCDAALTARGDRDKVIQILLNLVSNAVKFTRRGGQITLAAEAPDEHTVSIRVQDTGIGIPADKLDTIFDPFVQVDASRTRTGEGTGLGLAISRDLARGMDGDLVVVSSEGAGSIFTLRLPRSTMREPGLLLGEKDDGDSSAGRTAAHVRSP